MVLKLPFLVVEHMPNEFLLFSIVLGLKFPCDSEFCIEFFQLHVHLSILYWMSSSF